MSAIDGTSPEAGSVTLTAYTRLYTDADGHSRFEEVELPAETRGVGYAELVATFSEPIDADAVVFRNVLREAADDTPHNAPRRQFIVQMTGWCEVESSTGERRRFGPGSVLLVEDLVGHGHITRKIGEGERLTMLVTLPEDA
jgi:hypothetical protein